MKIKICGITTKEEVEGINELLPDYIGFVFAKSKRQINAHQAKDLRACLHPFVEAIGVFVNDDIEAIADLVDKGIIQGVQLHGDEDEAYIKLLKEKINVPIIKAIPVGEVLTIKDWDVTYYLFDHKSDQARGGTGEAFDWSLLKNVSKPYFLAGGICEHTIDGAIKASNYCIDLSTGVETKGKKDKIKMRRIIEKVRGIDEK